MGVEGWSSFGRSFGGDTVAASFAPPVASVVSVEALVNGDGSAPFFLSCSVAVAFCGVSEMRADLRGFLDSVSSPPAEAYRDVNTNVPISLGDKPTLPRFNALFSFSGAMLFLRRLLSNQRRCLLSPDIRSNKRVSGIR